MHFENVDITFHWFLKGCDPRAPKLKECRNGALAITVGVLIGMVLTRLLGTSLPLQIPITIAIITFATALYMQIRIWFGGSAYSIHWASDERIAFSEDYKHIFFANEEFGKTIPILDSKGIRDAELSEDGTTIYIRGTMHPAAFFVISKAFPELERYKTVFAGFNMEIKGQRESMSIHYAAIAKRGGKA